MDGVKNILVTGGAGFIGSHACKQLVASGYHPITYDNLSTGFRENVRFGPFSFGDVKDEARLVEVLRHYNPVAVIHFAACAYVGESVENPLKYYSNNICGMISLIKAMQKSQVNRLIFSSSCATYGIPDKLPILEQAPCEPINPYGRSKLFCEQIIQDVAASSNLRFVILRYFNAAGADEDGELREMHEPETHLIPNVIRALGNTGTSLEVFGDDYDTPDGTCVRDYVHVQDLADAHVRAVECLLGGLPNITLNIGTGAGYSIMEIINCVEQITGKRVGFRIAPRREGDPAVLVADTFAAQRHLGFRVQRSTLENIIRTALPRPPSEQ